MNARFFSSLANFSGLIDDNNELLMWGDNSGKQLNSINSEHQQLPKKYHQQVQYASMGRTFYTIIKTDGELLVYIGGNKIELNPLLRKNTIIQVSSNYSESYFLTNEGKIFSMNLRNNVEEFNDIPQGVINISASGDFIAMLTNKQRLYARGNLYSLLVTQNKIYKFKEIKEKILNFSCSYNSIFFVTVSGRAGNISSYYKDICQSPWEGLSHIHELKLDNKSEIFVNVVGGGYFGFAYTSNEDLYFIGTCHYGQSGNGKNKGAYELQNFNMSKVLLPGTLVGLVTGFAHAIARCYVEKKNKEIYFAWGYGEDFSLGRGTKGNLSTPTEIESLKDTSYKRFMGSETNCIFYWDPSQHKNFPKYFQDCIACFVTCLKLSSMKIPKFVLFEIFKYFNVHWFLNPKTFVLKNDKPSSKNTELEENQDTEKNENQQNKKCFVF
eukprot:TRINITY_DN4477_c0_g2_i1.p1 TRINITY_DN4477_c0_g2~~TRINITY_DN4477_c0_g2_i1.p1  ORF type:complete len:439 (-),score=94.53 TRINITY_DN4477_c0_g2_i1:43-1359(-)